MPGTALNWTSTKIPRGVLYHIWAGLAVPADGARLTLHTDGTPESVANPNAVHLGRSDEGAELLYRPTVENFFSDEFAAPYRAVIGAEEMRINASLKPVMDMAILDKISLGGTRATAAGYDQMKFGGLLALVTTSVAVIFRDPEDATKFCVWQLYKAFNESGIAFRMRRTQDGSTPVSFKGLAIPTRTAGDQLGSFWCQV